MTDARPDWLGDIRDRHDRNQGALPVGIVTYGSLLEPSEIRQVFSREDVRVVPIRVEGFVRLFNKEVAGHLRNPEGEARGVLNLRPESTGWFNGLLVAPVHDPALRKYAHREREYGLTAIESSDLSVYPSGDPAVLDELEAVYTCLLEEDERLDPDLPPIESYLELCLEGARHWGDAFYRDFVRSTLVRGRPLHEREEVQDRELTDRDD